MYRTKMLAKKILQHYLSKHQFKNTDQDKNVAEPSSEENFSCKDNCVKSGLNPPQSYECDPLESGKTGLDVLKRREPPRPPHRACNSLNTPKQIYLQEMRSTFAAMYPRRYGHYQVSKWLANFLQINWFKFRPFTCPWLPRRPSPTKGFLSWLGALRWHGLSYRDARKLPRNQLVVK